LPLCRFFGRVHDVSFFPSDDAHVFCSPFSFPVVAPLTIGTS
jgi:hypothetical protein